LLPFAVTFVRWPCSFGLCHPILINSIIIIINKNTQELAGLLSVRDSSRSARRTQIILDMLQLEPVIYETFHILQVNF